MRLHLVISAIICPVGVIEGGPSAAAGSPCGRLARAARRALVRRALRVPPPRSRALA